MKKSIAVALAAVLCGCGPQKAENKSIAPMPAGVSVENLKDCVVPAQFTSDDFNWMGGTLSMTVFNMDLYDAVEVSQLQVGDTIFYGSEQPVVISKIEEKDGYIDFNGGDLSEGGCRLAANEGGTYVGVGYDNDATYTKLGKAELPLSEDFAIIDCGEDPNTPSDTVRTGQKLYLENMKEYKRSFYPLSTLVTIENGVITQIARRWTP